MKKYSAEYIEFLKQAFWGSRRQFPPVTRHQSQRNYVPPRHHSNYAPGHNPQHARMNQNDLTRTAVTRTQPGFTTTEFRNLLASNTANAPRHTLNQLVSLFRR